VSLQDAKIRGMIDLAFVRANLTLVEEKLRARGMDPAVVLGEFNAFDTNRRVEITSIESLNAERNELSRKVGALKQAGDQDAAEAVSQEVRKLKYQIELIQKGADTADRLMRDLLMTLPNLPADDVPVGKSEHDNVEVKAWGDKPKLGFPPLPHWEIGEALGILDFERAAKISGSRFVVHYGQGARLERALANFMLDLHTSQHRYTEVLPPNLVNSDSLYGTGQLPKFEQDLFKTPTGSYEQNKYHIPVPGELVYAQGQNGTFRVVSGSASGVLLELVDVSGAPSFPAHQITVPRGALSYQRNLWLIPTAEVPVTNLFRDEVLEEAQLPISYCAYTPCYRSEAGSYGKDVRGMIRQHQFQKVELVKFAKPEESTADHEKLTRDAERVLELLGLPYRRVLLCTGDMGFSSQKTYDLEVWLPGQGLYREISSCSNFGAFQARRANIRYRPAGAKKTEYLHTLNGSGLAVGRTYLAILENYQQVDGTVKVPKALVQYMDGETVIGKQKGRG
jgi:seryl-tRNA synthetase